MPKKDVSVVDENGEIKYGVFMFRQKYMEGFFMMIQEQSKFIAKLDLTGSDHKVLWYLISVLDYENWIKVSQSEIAKDLEMKVQHVNRSIGKLVKQGILIKGPKSGVSWTYRIDPHIGWKGHGKNHKSAMEEVQKKRAIELQKKAKEKGWDIIEGGENS